MITETRIGRAYDVLTETPEVRKLRSMHHDYYLALAEQAGTELHGPGQHAWLDVLEAEHDNLRASLEWSLADSDSRDSGLRLAGSLAWFWMVRGYRAEGRRWLESALSGSAAAPPLVRAKVLWGLGLLNASDWRLAEASSSLEEGLTLYRDTSDRHGIARCLCNLGQAAERRGERESARALLEESLQVAREVGDGWTERESLLLLGQAARSSRDLVGARTLYEESLALARRAGDGRGVARVLYELSLLAARQGEHEHRRAFAEEGLALARELGERQGVVAFLTSLGGRAQLQGDYQAARRAFEEALSIAREFGFGGNVCGSLVDVGLCASRQADYEGARAPLEEALAIARETGRDTLTSYVLLVLGENDLGRGDAAAARGHLDEALATARRLSGWRSEFHTARALGYLALLERKEGDVARASELLREGLVLLRAPGEWITRFVFWLAGVAEGLGRHERAARLFGAAEASREEVGVVVPPSWRESYERDVAAVRAGLAEEAFRAAWAEGRAMSLEDAVVLALEDPR